jgi:hypothetical protein
MRMFFRLLQTGAPLPLLDEVQLLAESHRRYPNETLETLTRERLHAITRSDGVDLATALLYRTIRTSHVPFIEAVESAKIEPTALPHLPYKVWVMPAGFYREFPTFGGRGDYIIEIARRFGAPAEMVPVPSGASVEEGAAILRATLANEPDHSALIVSLSKGGTDTRVALLDGGNTANKVAAWLQMSGLPRGFHYGEWLFKGRMAWFWVRVGQLFLKLTRATPALFDELLTITDKPLPPVPPHLKIISVVACPLTTHLRGTMRSRHRELGEWGPNDGYGLTREAILEQGDVYPVWGADHYFRFPNMTTLLYQLFTVLCKQDAPL